MIPHPNPGACRTARRLALVLLAGLAACGGRGDTARAPRDTASAASAMPADSLVLTTPLGEVWFGDARTAQDAAGRPCLERVIEIRRDSTIKVPLLYTGAAPVLVDDSTLGADLWLHCRPIAHYTIDLRTGRPSPGAR